MPRPSKPKRVGSMPRCSSFFGEISKNSEYHILLSVEEFETLRLIDYLGMNQEECAASMNVSRITVQTLYADARKKVARFLVEGSNLQIEGGNFVLAPKDLSADGDRREVAEEPVWIAVAYEEGEVFQHFGRSTAFKLYQIKHHQIISSQVIDTGGKGHGMLVGFLKEQKVDVLICGGIGVAARNALAEAEIQLFAGACGNADAQVLSYLKGNLSYDPDFQCTHSREQGEQGCMEKEEHHSCVHK